MVRLVLLLLITALISCADKKSKSEKSNDSLTVDLPKNLNDALTIDTTVDQSKTSWESEVSYSCNNLDKDYFRRIKFPHYFLDSLYDGLFYGYNHFLKFTSCDNYIFKTYINNNYSEYISLQDSTSFYVVVGFNGVLGESHVFVCSLSKDYKLLDYNNEGFSGGGPDPKDSILMDVKIIRIRGEKKNRILQRRVYNYFQAIL